MSRIILGHASMFLAIRDLPELYYVEPEVSLRKLSDILKEQAQMMHQAAP